MDSLSIGSLDEDEYDAVYNSGSSDSDVDVVGNVSSDDEGDDATHKKEPTITVTVPAAAAAASIKEEEKKLTPPPSPDRRTAKVYRASYLKGLGGVLDKNGYLETEIRTAVIPGHAHLFSFVFNRAPGSSPYRVINVDMYSPDYHLPYYDLDGTQKDRFEREPFELVRKITGLDFCDNLSQFLSAIASLFQQSEQYKNKKISPKRIFGVHLALNHLQLAYDLSIALEDDPKVLPLIVGHQQLGQA